VSIIEPVNLQFAILTNDAGRYQIQWALPRKHPYVPGSSAREVLYREEEIVSGARAELMVAMGTMLHKHAQWRRDVAGEWPKSS